jgi:hypothetical protein
MNMTNIKLVKVIEGNAVEVTLERKAMLQGGKLVYDVVTMDAATFLEIQKRGYRMGIIQNQKDRAHKYVRLYDGKPVGYVHRLAMEIHGLMEEEKLVDHIDLKNTLDNRIKNLRMASRTENGAYTRKPKNNSTGFKNVQEYRTKAGVRYKVVITKKGMSPYTKYGFLTKEAAYKHAQEKRVEIFGDFNGNRVHDLD